jgi:WD40 repeat protein
MHTWLARWFGLFVLVLPFIAGCRAEPDESKIARLIKQLGDEDFEKREAATARLKEIGEPALDALVEAKSSDDEEVRRRAEEIVASIEDKLCVEEMCLVGHTDRRVLSVCVSTDGKRVLTSSADETLRLWDTNTGHELRVFTGHTDHVDGAALSPDGKRVLSASHDKTVRLWDADTGEELSKMAGHDTLVLSVAFGPEGKALSGDFKGRILIWDLKTGKKVGELVGHTEDVLSIAYSDQTKRAATASRDSSIRLWNLETEKEERKLDGSAGDFPNVCFSPDGKRLLSGCFDGRMGIWEVATGKQLISIHPSESQPCAAFSPDGKRIVSGDWLHPKVHLWDAQTGEELRQYEGHNRGVRSVVFFSDGKRIVSAGDDGTARIWRAPR